MNRREALIAAGAIPAMLAVGPSDAEENTDRILQGDSLQPEKDQWTFERLKDLRDGTIQMMRGMYGEWGETYATVSLSDAKLLEDEDLRKEVADNGDSKIWRYRMEVLQMLAHFQAGVPL